MATSNRCQVWTALSKYAAGITRWDLLLNSCVGHTTRALWAAGIPTIYAFHPSMLNIQLLIRQLGMYSSPYLYQSHKNKMYEIICISIYRNVFVKLLSNT